MKQVDFKHFKMFTDIAQENVEIVDVRKSFADLLYKQMNGIVAHDLALRIYRSEEPIILNIDEENLLREFSAALTPIFQDSLAANIVDVDKENK